MSSSAPQLGEAVPGMDSTDIGDGNRLVDIALAIHIEVLEEVLEQDGSVGNVTICERSQPDKRFVQQEDRRTDRESSRHRHSS